MVLWMSFLLQMNSWKREKILFSEKAFAYSMKNEAMKRKTEKRRKTQEGLLEALSQEKQLSPQKINEILNAIKKTDMSRVIFKNSQMYKYFPKYYSTEQMKEEIIELLEKERKRKERQRKREKKRMGTDVYSHIIDDDRRKNAELFEEAFYEKKDLDPSMHAHAAGSWRLPVPV